MFHFHKLNLNILFNDIIPNTKFENITSGRQGAVLVDSLDIVPLVRTTTKYNSPVQQFTNIHMQIMDEINKIDKTYIFNNALIEIYDEKYKTMGYHTDQALDLDTNSYICLFSCYNNSIPSRKLDIINKETNDKNTITLEHNSIVVFSVETNAKHQHRILAIPNISNQWLGITFRLSKTFIKFINEIPYFYTHDIFPTKLLTLATQEQQKDFFNYKKQENNEINFIYPKIYFTISVSDLITLGGIYNRHHSN
jgi:hypothetical protein